MASRLMAALGLGLIVVWIIGYALHQGEFVPWFDLVLGCLSLIMAPPWGGEEGRYNAGVFAPFIISAGAFAVAFASMARHDKAWLSWITFGFACLYLLLGLRGVLTYRWRHEMPEKIG